MLFVGGCSLVLALSILYTKFKTVLTFGMQIPEVFCILACDPTEPSSTSFILQTVTAQHLDERFAVK
jgi:hypothetical protein